MSSETLAFLIMFGGLLGLVGFVVSLICVAMVAGFTRSTHTVQYVPHEQPGDDFKTNEELEKENEKALLDKVGRIKDRPTVVTPIDEPIDQVNETEINF
jgi:hypothetical protein